MKALKLVITGIVQGVGFRPFIHRIAVRHNLKGYVKNSGGSEVEVWIEGECKDLSKFIKELYFQKPPPAILEEVEVYPQEPLGFKEFYILKSSTIKEKHSMIPPDFSICSECLSEILDPSNRRYRYPFNSCAWCGPRFSMIYRAPYDRDNTSMAKYKLCSECAKEYSDINNVRRHHAQGVSCHEDGPRLWLTDRSGSKVETKDPLLEAAKIINEGYIVAVKGLGGYHLAALASSDEVVLKLRSRKNRPRKPFAIMALDKAVLDKLVYLDEDSLKLLESPAKPIVLLLKKPDTPASKYVSPGLCFEGVFLPYTGLHYLMLLETKDKFLIMTSGNAHGKPMCIDEECAYRDLGKIADYFLVHDREIVNRVDDSVIRFTNGRPVMLRRGRGYAPLWIKVPFNLRKNYIALGADLQTAGAVGFSNKIVFTQYIGDVDDLDVLLDLDKYLGFLAKNYGVNFSEVEVVVDKHPLYASHLLAASYKETYGCSIVEVQHHLAHVLAVAFEQGLIEDFIGIAIDGAGYGNDGAIWGGEVLEVYLSERTYRRAGHLEYQPLDSDRTVYYPIRFFISVLARELGSSEALKTSIKYGLYELVPGGLTEIKALLKAIEMRKYSLTSSMGRVLDGASAFLNISTQRSYEGEPAILLESAARGGRVVEGINDLEIVKSEGGLVIKTTGIYLDLVNNIKERSIEDLAYTVQYILGRGLGEAALASLKGRRLSNSIVISGGAAVNEIIVKGIRDVLVESGVDILLPKRIPPNDGGIALGQIIAADLALKPYSL
ncbi:MAG: carbamoyltransferase HypF [Sulfolobales archaeon]|nr:carbamoyltransferase HypF [Sulfolobales archaeon]